MGLRELNIKHAYMGKGESILSNFLIPAISNSIAYDRITSFYTVESLLAISQGLDTLYRNKGKMRLIIGIHSVPEEIVDASIRKEKLKEQVSIVRSKLKLELSTLSDLLLQKRLATLAWMIEDGFLKIKVASILGDGLFHPKTLILKDSSNDRIAAIGSPNETESGLGGNFEQIMVASSWEQKDAIEMEESFFESLWNGRWEGVETLDITEDTEDMIRKSFNSATLKRNSYDKQLKECDILSATSQMPANFFVSGMIPALYMHQERAVLEALSRWPIRVLFADEVGLGKTFEIAATIAFLRRFGGVKRVVILTPKSVLQQWQDELIDHFSIEAWLYDSSARRYVFPGKDPVQVAEGPLSRNSPDIVLISAQFARGNKTIGSIFEKEGAVLPELLVVDEAHSARISSDISEKKKKTLMFKMLEQLTASIPHIILATATPMQKDVEEYHSMLNLLGLPKQWKKSKNYITSLRLIASETPPDISDAYNAYLLIKSTLDNMRPSLSALTNNEITVLNSLMQLSKESSTVSIGQNIIDSWDVFRSIFIKLHPAHLLTVRNTRRALEEVGYQFPTRNLIECSIEDSARIEMFYEKVNQYLSDDCFSVELILCPERKISIGFVRVSYRQRVASSLYSCKNSLSRRLEKLISLNETIHMIEKGLKVNITINDDEIDDFDSDDLMLKGEEYTESITDMIDYEQLKRALNLEMTSLNSLIKEATDFLEKIDDPKIVEAIRVAIKSAENSKKVLVFSRYTDTVDALIALFKKNHLENNIEYGVYTGQTCVVTKNGREFKTDKSNLRNALFSGEIQIVFCSDAASEGLNLQAAQTLINVDVPWTPSRLEQRIGRIARLGQKASVVDIYNIWYPNSIEAKMYHRIQQRLDATMLAVGEYPQVIADEIVASVIYDRDESFSVVDKLNDIRNSVQMRALNSLWKTRDEYLTMTHYTKWLLLELCKKHFITEMTDDSGEEITIMSSDGEVYKLSAEAGTDNPIDLSFSLFGLLTNKNIKLEAINRSNIITAFKDVESNKKLQIWGIVKTMLSMDLNSDDYVYDRPSLLPDMTKLDLSFSVNNDVVNPPELGF